MNADKRNERASLPVSRNLVGPPTSNLSETRIPLGPLTTVDMRDHAGRKGRVRNKVGMWGNLSPYYSNAVTIDSRWTQTTSNRSV